MAEEKSEMYLETRIEVPREHADAVCDFIVENITNGLVLEEEEDSPTTGIIFYVDRDRTADIKRLTKFLADIFGEKDSSRINLKQREIKGVEWLEEYRKSIRPIFIGSDIVVRPTWVEVQGARHEIVIEPKMAFGTGSHATTRSSMLAIQQHLTPGMTFLDVGCGSGILSILAAKIGASRIKAIDYDPIACENTVDNFRLNEVTVENDVLLGSIEKCDFDQPYDFVAANIIRGTILSMLDRLLTLTRPGGVLVLSGLLERDEQAISAALYDRDQTDFNIMHDEEWLTYVVKPLGEAP